ncbi:MAG: B12-binding domain-containing radical SAM protein [Bacteroidales bacterium]|nr:B12-binding domain-containing radical SAM protein [Bacteroidales bacterium]
MRVLLVGNPKTVMGFNRMTKIPSLNLASLAANVEEGICEIRVADLVVHDRNPEKALLRVLQSYQPDVVGFTAMSFQYAVALKLAALTRKTRPSARILMGGYHVTADAEAILVSPDMQHIDYLICGEGEHTFNELMKALGAGGNVSQIPGLAFLEEGKPVITPRAPLLDTDHIRIPDRDARIYKKGFHILGMPADVIETSRGCLYNCNFCSIRHMYGKSFRKFSIDRIMTDLEDARRHGARSIFITDDNITLDGKRYMQICNEITRLRLNMTFAVQASVRGIIKTPGLAEAMAQSGTRIVFLGIENVSDDVLHSMNKSDQLKSDDAALAVSLLKKHGVTVIVGGFIFGYPEDTRNVMLKNFHYAKKIGVDIQLFNILTPHLKTEIREALLKEGLVTNSHDYSRYNHYAANVRTLHLTDMELYRFRNMLDARYPVESGAIFRLFRAYPAYFSALMFRMIRREPRNWFSFTTGFLRR